MYQLGIWDVTTLTRDNKCHIKSKPIVISREPPLPPPPMTLFFSSLKTMTSIEIFGVGPWVQVVVEIGKGSVDGHRE